MAATALKDGWPSHIKFTKPILEGFEKRDCDGKQRTVWDTEQKGLCVLVSPKTTNSTKNTVTFRTLYYLNKKPAYVKIGRWAEKVQYRDTSGQLMELKCWDIEAVRRRASNIRNAANGDARADPKRPSVSGNVEELLETFIEEHAKKIRTGAETERILRRYVLPEWKHRNLADITKADITALLNKIEVRKFKGPKGRLLGTPQVADAVRAQLSKFFNWYSDDYNDQFRSPFVRIKRRTKQEDTERDRNLNDHELRALWKACGEMGVYGACVKTALLTAQRFFKVAGMRRSQIHAEVTLPGYLDDFTSEWVPELTVENLWDARAADDPKKKQVSEVPLSPLAKSIIEAVPIIDADARDYEDFVFSLNGKKPFQGWSNAKEILDKKMAELLGVSKVEPWQHRDLRRTARTLMPRAGVSEDIAERCLGHTMREVRRTYNRHNFLHEKQDAFARLAKLVDLIINPPDQINVVPLRR